MQNKNLVSLIVTTKNEELVLERLLKSIKNQTYSSTEIIVVDNNSKDKTKAIAKKFAEKVLNKGPERSVQRNYGVKNSSSEYILILDADMELTRDVVNECIEKALKDKKIGAVVIPEESVATNFWEEVKAFERSFYNLEGDDLTDAARFFTKEAFNKAGGYDEGITGPEDWDLPETIRKIGFKQARIKSKIYHHERIDSPFDVAKKKYYYALNSHRYLKKQDLPTFGPKTIYFLRPVFYKNWRKFLDKPMLSVGMVLMLSFELIYGGVGYLAGSWKKN